MKRSETLRYEMMRVAWRILKWNGV